MKPDVGKHKKKLLFVLPSLEAGGAERVVVNLINHLHNSKYEILLVLFSDERNDHKKDLRVPVRIICLKKKNRFDFFKLIFRLRREILRHGPETAISFLHYANIITVIANLFLKNPPRVIISERNYLRKYLPKTRVMCLRKWLIKFTYRRANMVLPNSKAAESALVEDFGITPGKIFTVHNPICFKDIQDKSREKVYHPFFTEKDAYVIIGAGRLTDQKRFDRLLKVFAQVKKRELGCRLIILGRGELLEELKALARRLAIDKWVDFVGFQPNPYAWIAKADIFVLSSDYEGFPNVILEAMACGTPVISTNCPSGPDEMISNRVNGILIPPADENALAEAISALLRNKRLRDIFSENGKKRAEDFDINKILPQYEHLFQRSKTPN